MTSPPPGVPRVSVVMPVYNAGPYLDAAVASILEQTFTDFEFVIADDGSTDGSGERLAEWVGRDSRIRLLRLGRRHGPVGAANAVVRASRAPLVARMDADDIAAPTRLAMQVAALDRNPRDLLVGGLAILIDRHGRKVRGPELAKLASARLPPIPHATTMVRREAFDLVGAYRERTDYFEDHDLLTRLIASGGALVITEPLVRLRFSGENTRLQEPLATIQQAINRLYADPAGNCARIDPMVYYTIANLENLAGKRPLDLLPTLRFADPSNIRLLLKTCAFLGLACLSPAGLRRSRSILAMLANLRTDVAGGKVYRWTAPGQLECLGSAQSESGCWLSEPGSLPAGDQARDCSAAPAK